MTGFRMKGQLAFEFIIAAVILFIIVMYVFNYLSTTTSSFRTSFATNARENRAVQISNVLLNSPYVGITDGWPLLSEQKLSAFEAGYCQSPEDYEDLLDTLGLVSAAPYIARYVHIDVTGIDGTSYLKCGNSPVETVGWGKVTRYAYYLGRGVVKVEVTVW